MAAPLTNKTIWLTRPAHQSAGWASILEAAGARVVVEPLIAIDAPSNPPDARRAVARAADADIVVACSANAVDWAWRLVPDFAPKGTLYAVGAASAAALAAACGRCVVQPGHGDTSEALLGLDGLADPNDCRVALLTGEGGRAKLADSLRARGAAVDKLGLYRRRGCAIATARLADLLVSSDAVVVTSGEALDHLLALAGATEDPPLHDRLAQRVLVAPSERVVQRAGSQLRWAYAPLVVDRVSGEAVVDVLARFWRGDGQ